MNQTDEIDQSKILGVYNYSHPVFTAEGVDAQSRRAEISGANNTWFCGAYWGNGFHEDGVSSALHVVDSVNSFTTDATAGTSSNRVTSVSTGNSKESASVAG